ncbi:MAG TPA: hypothetical protein VJL59_12430 [Anaerolineales bacterium]|nr:hypothetical protein [Anaerolineales bacterium]
MPNQQTPTSSISSILLGHVRFNYQAVLEQTIDNELKQTDATSRVIRREGINIITPDAPSAYILAVATVEAFVNEVFLGTLAQSFIKGTPLENLSEALERIDISTKLIILPQLAFNKSLQKDQPPYQDMALLIKVRNDLVHYKMELREPKYLKSLQDRHIALRWPNIPWTFALSTSEGIRWAHNTTCETIQKVYEFLPDGYRAMLRNYIEDFSSISKEEVEGRFAEHRINIDAQ